MKQNKTAVILFGRNDGYKEKARFKIHITTMLETFDEVVYVDWNSPSHSFLYEVIDDLPKTGRLKHIVIPPEYAQIMTAHDPKAQSCSTPLAINIGLRRTDAEWITISTTDIIPPFKSELKDFIKKADSNSFYTLSRREISYEEVIKNSQHLTEYRQHLGKTTQPRYFPTRVTPNDVWSIFNCCGDFQLAHKNVWEGIKGYEEGMLAACFSDTNVQKKATLYGFNLVPVYDIPLYHMSHTGMGNEVDKNGKALNPTKQYYNDAYDWVEEFTSSYNSDTWGFLETDIEHEMF